MQLLSNLNYPIGNIINQELQNANSVKFTDSVFSPDEEYLAGYSDVYKAFLQNSRS